MAILTKEESVYNAKQIAKVVEMEIVYPSQTHVNTVYLALFKQINGKILQE